MRRPRRSSTLPKLAQITGPSSHHLAAPDLFRLWSVRWRRPQLRPGSGRVENVPTASSASRWRRRRFMVLTVSLKRSSPPPPHLVRWYLRVFCLYGFPYFVYSCIFHSRIFSAAPPLIALKRNVQAELSWVEVPEDDPTHPSPGQIVIKAGVDYSIL